jgi:nucleoid-associated protein YgaU
MGASSLAKAVIINLDQNSQRVECLFNPAEYTFSKQNEWTRGAGSGHDLPQIEFSNGQPATLQMQLFFDTYAQRKDVRGYTDKIWELMLVDENLRDPKSGKARPPLVRFQWGKNWTFDAVITRISQRFTLFLDDGTPVRASLDLAFEQIKDTRQLKPQNPTSRGVGGERLWTVSAGDTLPGIAYAVYGSPARWRVIAEHNNLYDVRRLAIGTVLEIPNA